MAATSASSVDLAAQAGRVDERRRGRVGGGEPQRAAARGTDDPGHQRVAVGRALHALEVERQMEEERLDVGRRQARAGCARRGGCAAAGGPGSGGGTGRDARVDDRREHVVVQVAPDAGRSATTSIPRRPSSSAGADAREQQQLGRLDRAGADDDLALGADLLDAHRPGRSRRRRSARPRRAAAVRGPRSARSGRARRRPARGRPSRAVWRTPSLTLSWQNETPSSCSPL